MKHTESKKSTSKSSFVQSALLVLFLFVGFSGYKILKRGNFSAGLDAFINMDVDDMRSLQALKEGEKPLWQKKFGGFWVYETTDSTARIKKHDCLELRDNGIIWQVITWNVTYPSGDSGLFYHLRYGFLNPYGTGGSSENIVCEVRTIRQAYINGSDTCFGASQVDELWQVRKDDSVLVMNRKRYVPYHGELPLFFPEGMIDIIDQLILEDCRHNLTPADIVKDALSADYTKHPAETSPTPELVNRHLSDYYKAAYIDEIFSSIPFLPSLPDSIPVTLACSTDSTVTIVMRKSKRAQLSHFEKLILAELDTWPVPSGCSNHDIKYTIVLPKP